MQLPKNPRRPDGDWKLRSPDEQRAFEEAVKRLGQRASPEELSRTRERVAFAEDEKIREALGIANPRKRLAAQRANGLSFDITPELLADVKKVIQRHKEIQGQRPVTMNGREH